MNNINIFENIDFQNMGNWVYSILFNQGINLQISSGGKLDYEIEVKLHQNKEYGFYIINSKNEKLNLFTVVFNRIKNGYDGDVGAIFYGDLNENDIHTNHIVTQKDSFLLDLKMIIESENVRQSIFFHCE
jgi:hypothetical protein